MIALECKGAANAAAHPTKALLASRVLSTSAAIAKARSNPRATECKLRCAKNAAKPATARTHARFVRAMHVVFEVTNYKRAICVLNTCALYVTAKNCQECQTCKLFGHVAKDCVYANCLDVDVDWFNLLFTKSESTVQAYFAEVNGKWGKKYCAIELDIDHLYSLPVSAPQIYAAASTSSTNTPTSTPTKQLNTRLTEINFD